MNKYGEEILRIKRDFHKAEMHEMMGRRKPGDLHVMRCIEKLCKADKAAKVPVSDLVKMMEVPPPAVSRCMRQLEKDALIERTLDEGDRRKTWVCLTEKGLQELENFNYMLETCVNNAVKTIGEEKVLDALSVFSQLIDSANREYRMRKEEWTKEGRL